MAILVGFGLGGCGRAVTEGPGPAPGGKAVATETNTSQVADGEIPPEQLEAVQVAHFRGVGRLEQYRYEEAIEAFRDAHKLAPNWLSGRINLAIALWNGHWDGERTREEALELLESVLSREPDNLRAHYCRGILLDSLGLHQRAHTDFQYVVDRAPNDGHAWYWLGESARKQEPSDGLPAGATRAMTENLKEAITDYRKALECNPFLLEARYTLGLTLRQAGDQAGMDREIAIWKRLRDTPGATEQADEARGAHGLKGPLGEVISSIGAGPKVRGDVNPPRFAGMAPIRLDMPAGDHWAAAGDFSGPLAALSRARARFGAPVAVLDADGDGRLDLFLPAAIAGPLGVRDALLRNRGDGAFEDVTRAYGLPADRASLDVAVGDFDADGRVDFYLTGVGGNRLYRNLAPNGFTDVTAQAGVAGPPAVSLTARWIDLDQDGDLDLYVINHTTLDHAERALTDQARTGAANIAYRNDGKPPTIEGLPPQYQSPVASTPSKSLKRYPVTAGLSIAFSRWPDSDALSGGDDRHTGLAALDVDGDRDIDLILTADGAVPRAAINDRLGRFRSVELKELEALEKDNGLLVTHLDQDGRPDISRLDATGSLRASRNRIERSRIAAPPAFEPWPCRASVWQIAVACDLDLDGLTDLVGLGARNGVRELRWARNDGTAMTEAPLRIESTTDRTAGPTGLCLADLVGDALPDLIVLTDGDSPRIARNLGNGHNWLGISLSGRWQDWGKLRSNPHGIGSQVRLEGPRLESVLEATYASSGLAQVVSPSVMGLGATKQASVIRIRWPDGASQTEVDVPANQSIVVEEQTHRVSTCPTLFAWDGSRYRCVSDLLAGGGLGYYLAPAVYAEPDRDESVAIPDELICSDAGAFRIVIAEPMDETAYLDQLKLDVVDRPPGVVTTPDERFATAPPRPTGELIAWKTAIGFVRATDLAGRDITEVLRVRDRRTADEFSRIAGWNGYAEEHGIVLDFGDRLSRFGPSDPLVLCLAGWVEYPFSQTNYAASTAGVSLMFPTLERQRADGSWEVIEANPGCPAGLPRMTTLDLTGKLTGPRCVLRLRTNLECYWDQAFIALRERDPGIRVSTLSVLRASLGYHGHMNEVSTDGRMPLLYDFDSATTKPLALMMGRLTRYGEVSALLKEDDDQLCVVGPGDLASIFRILRARARFLRRSPRSAAAGGPDRGPPGIHLRRRMATDDMDPDLPISDQGLGAATWLATLCAGRHLEIVGPSRHGPDAIEAIWSMMGQDQELWVVAPRPLGAAALGRFKELLPVMGGLLWHPNIWPILDGGVHEGRPYLLVPRFAGDTLRERIADRPLPVAEAVALAIALCRAVHFAHDAGFVELDLSAHQVLLADGRPPMIDLRRTLTRRVLQVEGCWIHGGITGCEAPELLRGEEAGREADVYSLGAILYQMLTGRRTLTQLAAGPAAIREILERDPERPRKVNKCVDRALESICLRCLAKQRTRRFDSAASIGEELARWRSNAREPGLIGRLRRRFLGRACRWPIGETAEP
jgi:hypothetical protein